MAILCMALNLTANNVHNNDHYKGTTKSCTYSS